jgi:preprotein translocase subunit SecD
MQAVREGRTPRRSRLLPRTAVVLAVVLSLAVICAGVAMFAASSREHAPSRPGAAPPGRLVVTTWTPDPSASDPPYPGYRPAISSITSDMITNAQVVRNSNGDIVVQVKFDSRGTEIFRNLTAQAAAACPQQECPQRHLTMWLDLNQDDVDHWTQRANDLYRPFYRGGKLLTDPAITAPIPGGSAQITGNFNQQQAEDLAHRLNR